MCPAPSTTPSREISTRTRDSCRPTNWTRRWEKELLLAREPAAGGHWGKGYFGVNPAGHLVVRPDTTPGREIDLYEVVQGLKERDLTAPVVMRFSGILAHRLRHLHDAFAQAIAENEYRNRYAAVFPIKVNQQRLVVEEVYRYGKRVRLRPRSGQQARTARGHGDDRGFAPTA
jgi:arginine decarboxylase-like protein